MAGGREDGALIHKTPDIEVPRLYSDQGKRVRVEVYQVPSFSIAVHEGIHPRFHVCPVTENGTHPYPNPIEVSDERLAIALADHVGGDIGRWMTGPHVYQEIVERRLRNRQ